MGLRKELWKKDICFLIQRTARVIARRVDYLLRPCGLTHGQFILLAHISQSEVSTMTSLASLLAMDRTTLTAALKKLEMKGFVTIETSMPDRRTKQIAVTCQGRNLLKRAARVWMRSNMELISLLQSTVNLGTFCKSLDRLSAGISRSDSL
jgi:DNA-binding MarR family transcriptional regulator